MEVSQEVLDENKGTNYEGPGEIGAGGTPFRLRAYTILERQSGQEAIQ
jgi:hypothetical protein